MRLPKMKYGSGIRKGSQMVFGGLNMSKGAGEGELADMRNLTADHYPVLGTRERRYRLWTLQEPGGIFSWDGLAWVEGTGFYYEGTLRGQVTAGEKTFGAMGAYIVILPDKCYYNVRTQEFGSLESKWEGTSLIFSDGLLYGGEAKANQIRCAGANWADWFRTGDAVTIAGCTGKPENNMTIIIRDMEGDKLWFYENSFTLGTGGAAVTESGALSIARTVPDLKFLCENENRLWGCTDTTIYACKLGDIFNWNVYDGLDTDAFAVETGSAGDFTGCASFGGYPTFFKEEHVYRVYGSLPSNFEVLGSATLGLEKGSGKSLAVAGETLFYLNRSGIVAYTGGIPQPIADAFGTEQYRNGVAGSDGLKYYISMEDCKGQWSMFVYDTTKGLWHREDESRAMGFAMAGENLTMLGVDGVLQTLGVPRVIPEGAEAELQIQWYAEFADFTSQDPNKKGIGKIQIRLELEEGAEAKVLLMVDSDGVWHQAGHVLGEGPKRSYYLPIVPRRADHYRLRIEGTGECRIHSITRELYSGSELRSTYGRN